MQEKMMGISKTPDPMVWRILSAPVGKAEELSILGWEPFAILTGHKGDQVYFKKLVPLSEV